MTDDDRLICTQPFTWCEVHGDGSVFACCPSWLNVPLGNLLQTPWGDIWNGAIAKGLRCSVLDETFVQCNHTRCPRLAGPSAPVMTLKDVKPAALRHLLHHKMTHLPFGPRKINLCYDHRCNLACPSCRRDFMLVGKRAEGRMHQIEARLRRFIGPELEEMTVAGFGDPFGSPSYRSLLQGLDKSVFPRLQIIRLHTNGLLWDQGMWTSMPYASDLVRTAEISIDAADASTYAINRRGGNFSQLLSNLAFIATLNVAVKLSFIVQQNNYREIPDFVALAHGFGFEVYFSQLVNWGTFSHQDYASRAVHCQAHPEHVAFLGILKDVADLERVDIGNLRPLLGAVAD